MNPEIISNILYFIWIIGAIVTYNVIYALKKPKDDLLVYYCTLVLFSLLWPVLLIILLEALIGYTVIYFINLFKCKE